MVLSGQACFRPNWKWKFRAEVLICYGWILLRTFIFVCMSVCLHTDKQTTCVPVITDVTRGHLIPWHRKTIVSHSAFNHWPTFLALRTNSFLGGGGKLVCVLHTLECAGAGTCKARGRQMLGSYSAALCHVPLRQGQPLCREGSCWALPAPPQELGLGLILAWCPTTISNSSFREFNRCLQTHTFTSMQGKYYP